MLCKIFWLECDNTHCRNYYFYPALFVNRRIAQRNIRLSFQQEIFKVVSDKIKEINVLWESEPENEKQNSNSPHFKIISEIIISIEILERSFFLFEKNYKSIKQEFEGDFYFFFGSNSGQICGVEFVGLQNLKRKKITKFIRHRLKLYSINLKDFLNKISKA